MNHNQVHVILAVVGAAAGTAAAVLPFTWGVSPLEASTWPDLWWAGVPFFLAWPTAAASLRWIQNGMRRRSERMLAYLAGATGLGITLFFLIMSLAESLPSQSQEWISLSIPFIVIAAASHAIKRVGLGFGPVLTLQLGYIANALYCLVSSAGEWQTGAFCGAATTAIYITQTALIARTVDVRPD